MLIEHPCPQTKLFYGDALCLSIAAASVVAKVHRDALLRTLDTVHPAYGLAQHKGYGTPEHRKALAAHGPSPLHRLSFHLGIVLDRSTSTNEMAGTPEQQNEEGMTDDLAETQMAESPLHDLPRTDSVVGFERRTFNAEDAA